MSETPPPRDPRDPADDETVVVPPAEPPLDETVVVDEWAPGQETYVEQTEIVPPRRLPVIWPWLLALLLVVLGGLGAYYYFSQDDDEAATTTTAATTTQVERVSVPDVVGTTSSQATATLTGAGLDVNVVAVPSDAPSGQVVAQSPAAGNEVAEGSTVRLNVAEDRPAPPAATTTSEETTTAATTTDAATTTTQTTTQATTTAPPEPATVPDVVGRELADAARAFRDEGLKISAKYVPSSEAAGRVVAQAQPAGTQRKRGDTVQLNISIGAEPAAAATVPDVVGQQQADGRRTLEQAGLEVLALSLDGQVRNESPVASQTPSGGASVPRGSLVILYVGA